MKSRKNNDFQKDNPNQERKETAMAKMFAIMAAIAMAVTTLAACSEKYHGPNYQPGAVFHVCYGTADIGDTGKCVTLPAGVCDKVGLALEMRSSDSIVRVPDADYAEGEKSDGLCDVIFAFTDYPKLNPGTWNVVVRQLPGYAINSADRSPLGETTVKVFNLDQVTETYVYVSGGSEVVPDGGVPDGNIEPPDAGSDTGTDGEVSDGEIDGEVPDSGTDAEVPDSGEPDSGEPDSGEPDSGEPDSGTDSGSPEDSGTEKPFGAVCLVPKYGATPFKNGCSWKVDGVSFAVEVRPSTCPANALWLTTDDVEAGIHLIEVACDDGASVGKDNVTVPEDGTHQATFSVNPILTDGSVCTMSGLSSYWISPVAAILHLEAELGVVLEGACAPMATDSMEHARVLIDSDACENLLSLVADPGDLVGGEYPEAGVDPAECDDSVGIDCPHLTITLPAAPDHLVPFCAVEVLLGPTTTLVMTPIAPN
jgi:hypothetical protein